MMSEGAASTSSQDRNVVFAVPGDIETLTGGYKYDRRLMSELRRRGWTVRLLRLADGFPDPSEGDLRDSARQFADVPSHTPIVVDGLALGVFDQSVMDAITGPVVALIHHPLARETGLSQARSADLLQSERHILSQVAHVLATSPHTADVLISDYDVQAANITIARPGVDHSRAEQVKHDPPLILSVGIKVPRKGHDVLLKALARITHLPWRVVIVGGTFHAAHASELDSLVADLGLIDRVQLVGQVSDAELTRLYAQAQIFALATRYEGHGLVFDEAMVNGLPIVSCNVGAVPKTIEPEAGLLAPPDDPAAFAEKLATLLSDNTRRARMAKASERAGNALPTWANTAAIVDNALQAVVSVGVPLGVPFPAKEV